MPGWVSGDRWVGRRKRRRKRASQAHRAGGQRRLGGLWAGRFHIHPMCWCQLGIGCFGGHPSLSQSEVATKRGSCSENVPDRNKSMSSAASKSTRAACRSDAPPGPTTLDFRILSHPPPQRPPKGAVVANARKASCAALRSTAAQQPPPFGPQESTTEGSALEAKKSRQFRGRRMVTNIKLGGPALWSQGI